MKRFVGRERESERVVLGCLLAIMANKYIDVFREKKRDSSLPEVVMSPLES